MVQINEDPMLPSSSRKPKYHLKRKKNAAWAFQMRGKNKQIITYWKIIYYL